MYQFEKPWTAFCAADSERSAVDEIEKNNENLGFKSFDAMHISCSESANVNVFLTTDDKLLKTAEREKDNLNVKIANPLSWLTEIL